MASLATDCIRILLIDDHKLMRIGLRMWIESQPGMAIMGEAANRADAFAIVARERPDAILLDLDLGDESGLDFLPELIAATKGAPVILVTGVRAPEEYQRAVQLGAMGLVLKEQAAEVLIQAIKTVHAGQIWLDPVLVARVLAAQSRQRAVGEQQIDTEAARIGRLTPREREVIVLIGEGLYNKQIAERL